jgi:benzoyl-CoA reductase subunit C
MSTTDSKAAGMIRETLSQPDAFARRWKESGKKVAGYRCLFVPEEMIWSAGMLPYPLYGTAKPITRADAYFQPCTCEFIRSIFDHALEGRYNFLDCLILSNTCDVIRRLPDLWGEYVGGAPVHMINNPQKLMHEGNRRYYLTELETFKKKLEDVAGSAVTAEKLSRAISLYNETRRLLMEIYDLRRHDPPLISGVEAFEAAMAATILPKPSANDMLKRLLDEIGDREAPDTDAPRILVTGSIMENPALIRMIEEEGGAVVADDLCTTTRWFWRLVDESAEPMEAMYEYLNSRPLCASMHPMEARIDYVMELIDRFKAVAVINFNLKYCHPFLYEAPLLGRELDARGVPNMVLEVGHDMSGHGQLRTRIQAFIEMIE